MAYQPHGVQNEQVVPSRQFMRDTRHPTQRLWDFLSKAANIGLLCLVMAGLLVVYPALTDLALVIGVFVLLRGLSIRPRLPLKLPDFCSSIDRNDPVPGDRGQYFRARGTLFLGNDIKSVKELWQSFTDVLTHYLIIGGTNSGKTETMLSMASNPLLWGSGFSYTDGKGESSLWSKGFAMARACGREDDLYVINYMTASTTIDPDAPIQERLTNQFNPYLTGSADSLIQLTASLLSEASGDSATWREKALGLLTVIAQIVYNLRERGIDERGQPFVLDVSSFRRYFTLDTLINVHLRAKHQVDDFTLSQTTLNAVLNYLESVPGYRDPEKLWRSENPQTDFDAQVIRDQRYPTQPEPQAYIQHGYLQNQFTRVFSQLSDVYGHIYRCHYGEIDFRDIVLNRRILFVMLPALEKSPDELSSLGKIIIAAKKTMLATGLGSRLEGTHKDVIENKPIHSESPFMDFNDEYGYYAVKGFAVVPAQARSIGFSVVFGAQDTPSFGKESKEEAQAVFGNTLTKMAMLVEDANESFELFQKTAGDALITQTSGFTRHDNAWLSNYYHDNAAASVERRNRIDLRDIRSQRVGQAHIFRGADIIRANLYFADIPTANRYQINRFIQVLPLANEDIKETQKPLTVDAIQDAQQQILSRDPLLALIRVQAQHSEGEPRQRAQQIIHGLTRHYADTDDHLANSIQVAQRQTHPQDTPSAHDDEVGEPVRQEASSNDAENDWADFELAESDIMVGGLCQDYDTFDEHAPELDDEITVDDALIEQEHVNLGRMDRFMLAALTEQMMQGKLPVALAAAVQSAPAKAVELPKPPVLLGNVHDCEKAWHGTADCAQKAAEHGLAELQYIPQPMAVRPRQRSTPDLPFIPNASDKSNAQTH